MFARTSRSSSSWILLVAGTLLVASAAEPALAQSKQEKKRQELLEKLGLEPKAAPPPGEEEKDTGKDDEKDESKDDEPPAPESPPPGEETPAETTGGAAPTAKKSPPRTYFVPRVHDMLTQRCQRCHKAGKKAAQGGFVFSGDPQADYDAVLKFVNRKKPLESAVLVNGLGKGHKGKPPLAAGSADQTLLEAWLSTGSAFARGPVAPAAPVAEAAPADTARPSSPSTGRPAGGSRPGVAAPAAGTAATAPTTTAAPQGGAPEVAPGTAETGEAPLAATPGEPGEVAPVAEAPAAPLPLLFVPEVHAMLVRSCAECHAPDEMGAESGYVVTADVESHYASARGRVVPGDPASSRLYTAALGADHGGDLIFERGSPEATLLERWIRDGAWGTTPPAPAPGAVAAAPTPGAPQPTGVAGAPVYAPSPAGGPPAPATGPILSPQPLFDALAGISPLLAGISLHGRFDLSYERRNYRGNPVLKGDDGLQSYHHFLFLSRHTATDPFGLDVEITSLQFWQLTSRLQLGPGVVGGRVGKLLVPFGAEPPYHSSYGGLAGFDQKILPVVWAQEGAALWGEVNLYGVGLTADVYAVRGYRLRDPDAVLNLQSDFSNLEDIMPGVGGRLSASWGPFRAWYSAYYNPLDDEHRLFMQAFDAGFYRWRTVPFLRDVAVSFGVLRGDVTGGGAGKDHYHFGSYFQVRYWPWEGLYLQYRQGLRTFNNRRGLFLDDTRLTSEDASTHSVAIVGTWRGITFGAWHFWNIEKVNEVDDDFLRLTVGYAF